MTFILTAIAFIRGSRAAQIALAVVTLLIAFGLWLHFHDNAVRKADRATATAKATKQAKKASTFANGKQELRNEAFETSQRELANTSEPDDYLVRLRASQCKANPARCR